MKTIFGIGQLKKPLKSSVVAIGVFDGVHRGHQKLISKAVAKAKKLKTQSVIITFSPHPVSVLHPKFELTLITSLEEKLKYIEALGVDIVLVVNFNKQFAFLPSNKFIEKYIVGCFNPFEIFVGEDFRFGSGRAGSVDTFRQASESYSFKINKCKLVKSQSCKVSSSHIRNLIKMGELAKAKQLLGRYVSVVGKVVKGDARGRKLGFPTANLIPGNTIIPPLGVYAVFVGIGNRMYKGVTNIGLCPVFRKNIENVTIETFVFSFHKSLYGKEIKICFVKKLRDEINFENQEMLIVQMKKDEKRAKNILLKEMKK